MLWLHWWNVIWLLRPAFSRLRTFMWFATAVAGITVRTELLGVTSIVRALALQPRFYDNLLDLFHSSAVKLDRLSVLWTEVFNGYSFNERCMLSLGVVDADVKVGDILTLVWGEPEPTGKTSTEQHKQTDIRVRVAPTPYAREARENYAESWRTKAK